MARSALIATAPPLGFARNRERLSHERWPVTGQRAGQAMASAGERGYQDDEAGRRGGKAARRYAADAKVDFAVIRAVF